MMLAELAGLGGTGAQLSDSATGRAYRRVLNLAIQVGPANIPALFSRAVDELGGSTLNDVLLGGEIDRAGDALEVILERHPELRIVRIVE